MGWEDLSLLAKLGKLMDLVHYTDLLCFDSLRIVLLVSILSLDLSASTSFLFCLLRAFSTLALSR